ncbi:MAG: helix-turn-helix domain-containing protein [Alphaproteobacteria bacterium]|nr:helix-turn-helix domain-containing protein [Alphaproteobacteria bacterium]
MIDEGEAATFLGYSVRALQNWRVRGGGPKFVKVSARSVRYRRRDLIAWADARLCASTSNYRAG